MNNPKILLESYKEKCNIENVPYFPINYEYLCEIIGVTLKQQFDTKTVLGRYAVTPENMEIRIARSLEENHKRYVVTHMIAHLMMHLDFILDNKFYTESIYPRSEEPYRTKENEADSYTREVLLPEKNVEKVSKDFVKKNSKNYSQPHELYEALVTHLAEYFGVDRNVVKRRVVEVGVVEFIGYSV